MALSGGRRRGRGGGGCGKGGGYRGGRGSHLCRASAAAIATYTPSALLGAGGSAGASWRALRSPGQQRGRPAAACTAASAALGGPGRSEGESESPGAEPGRQLQEGARPTQPPSAPEPRERRPAAPWAVGWEHRSPEPQGWSRSGCEARCSAPCWGSPPPADLPGLRAAAARGCALGRPRPKKLVVRSA